MDILYILGTGSTHDNAELRYSLRSICRHGRQLGRVYLVGECPDFINRDQLIYIPCADVYQRKHKNILHKVETAMEQVNMPEHFLISSDDHFYLRDTNFDYLPVYYRKEQIPYDITEDQKRNPYFRSLVQTRDLLEAAHAPVYQTNPHCNTHWDMDIYRRYRHLFDKAYQCPDGGEMNCLMGNLLIANGWQYMSFNDSKLDRPRTLKANDERTKNCECISCTDRWFDNLGEEWLARRFPDKCRFEK